MRAPQSMQQRDPADVSSRGWHPGELHARPRPRVHVFPVRQEVVDPGLPRHGDEDDPLAIGRVGRPGVERGVARQALAACFGANADAVHVPPLHGLPGRIEDGAAIR